MADLRFNCTEKYKRQIKKQAVDIGVSVSQLLSEVVLSAIPADDDFVDFDEIRKELDEVRNDLIYNSSSMSQEERNSLKLRNGYFCWLGSDNCRLHCNSGNHCET